jgi:hypothetical protein
MIKLSTLSDGVIRKNQPEKYIMELPEWHGWLDL